MQSVYRIEGPGTPEALMEASAAADRALAEMAGTGDLAAFGGWLTYLFALGGAACVMLALVLPMVEGALNLSAPLLTLGAIFVGVLLFSVGLRWLNGVLANRFARGWCNDPRMKETHIVLSSDGLVVTSGRCHTTLDWADVTRIEATPRTILVMAGYMWSFMPLDGFENMEQAQAALADMRAWQAEARV